MEALLDRMERRLEARDWIEAEADRLLPEATADSAARIAARLTRNGMDPAEAEEVAASRAAKVAPTVARRRARYAAVPAFGRRAVFGKPPRIQIKGSASLGKTRAIVEEYATRPSLWNRNIAVYVPLIVLSEQFATDAREAVAKATPATNGTRGRVLVIRGREHAAADGSTMCHPQRLPVIAAATRAGCGSVYHACCRTPANAEHAETTCPHYAWCAAAGYIAQFDNAPALRLFAHSHLALPQPKDLHLPTPDLAVVDESALGALMFHKEVDPAWLTDPATYSVPDDELRAVAIDIGRATVAAFTGTGPALEALRAAGITPADLREAAGCADATHEEPKVVAGMSAKEALKRFEGHRPTHGRPVAGVLRQLARDLERGRPTSLAIEYDQEHTVSTDSGTRVQHPIFRRHGIRDVLVPKSAALLLLDADAIIDANKIAFGSDLRSFTIAAARVAHVTQIIDAALATSSLAPGDELANNSPKAEKLRSRIEAFVDKLAAEEKRVLVIACLPVRRALTGEGAGKLAAFAAWHGTEISHHGAILGSNRWKDFDAVVLIGREQLPPVAAERQARAIWGDAPAAALSLTGAYQAEGRAHDLRNGAAPAVKVWAHADPRVQALVELKRERAMAQAIDRLRLIHRPADAPGEIYVLSNLPVPGLVVDRLMRLDDLLDGGTPLERAMARMAEGMLPLSPAWLHEKMADLFTSKRTAEREVANFDKPPLGNIVSHCQVAVYRVAGQKRPSKALVRVGAASPKGALVRLLGVEIVDFRFMDAPATPAPARVLAALTSAPEPPTVPAEPVVSDPAAEVPALAATVPAIEEAPVLALAEHALIAAAPAPSLAAEALPLPAPAVVQPIATVPAVLAAAQPQPPPRIVFFRHPAAPANAAWIIPATAAAKRAMEGRCDAA